MIITGPEIKRLVEEKIIQIKPFDASKINPNSYNITLNKKLLVYEEEILDMKKPNAYTEIEIPEEGIVLEPGKLYLGCTNEYTSTPVESGLVPMLEGRSSVGRLGIDIHATAGFGDIGFKGSWTLEISCIQPVRIYANVDIGQLYYHTVKGEIIGYNSKKYTDQINPRESRMYLDFK